MTPGFLGKSQLLARCVSLATLVSTCFITGAACNGSTGHGSSAGGTGGTEATGGTGGQGDATAGSAGAKNENCGPALNCVDPESDSTLGCSTARTAPDLFSCDLELSCDEICTHNDIGDCGLDGAVECALALMDDRERGALLYQSRAGPGGHQTDYLAILLGDGRLLRQRRSKDCPADDEFCDLGAIAWSLQHEELCYALVDGPYPAMVGCAPVESEASCDDVAALLGGESPNAFDVPDTCPALNSNGWCPNTFEVHLNGASWPAGPYEVVVDTPSFESKCQLEVIFLGPGQGEGGAAGAPTLGEDDLIFPDLGGCEVTGDDDQDSAYFTPRFEDGLVLAFDGVLMDATLTVLYDGKEIFQAPVDADAQCAGTRVDFEVDEFD